MLFCNGVRVNAMAVRRALGKGTLDAFGKWAQHLGGSFQGGMHDGCTNTSSTELLHNAIMW
jgi:hypothetical protein